MTAQGVLALGILLIAALWAIRLARRQTPSAGDDHEEARRLIGKEIDAHVEALAQRYLEAGWDQGVCRPGTDCFGQAVELFIGELLRRAERSEPWLKDALREHLVLRRDEVYGAIVDRVEAQLRRSSCAE